MTDDGGPPPDVYLTDGIVRLRSFRLPDYEFLYSLLAIPQVGLRFRSRGSTPSPEDFRALLWRDVFAQFMTETVDSKRQPLGYVSSYNANLRNGVAYLATIGSPRAIGTGLMMRAMSLLISYLFDNWPFRKLYFESPEATFASFSSVLAGLFVEEGRLREFEFTGKGYDDVVVCSLEREAWARAVPAGLSVSAAAARRAVAQPVVVQLGSDNGAAGAIDLDRFLGIVSQVIGSVPQSADNTIRGLNIDSLHVLEILSIIEELAGRSLEGAFDVNNQMTLRELFLLYCTLASMPKFPGS